MKEFDRADMDDDDEEDDEDEDESAGRISSFFNSVRSLMAGAEG